ADGNPQYYGSGSHSTYESLMLDRVAMDGELIPAVQDALPDLEDPGIIINKGSDAAFAIIKLLDASANTLPVDEIFRVYEESDGYHHKSMAVLRAMWTKLGPKTAKVLALGAQFLALIWESAFMAANGDSIPSDSLRELDANEIRARYIQK